MITIAKNPNFKEWYNITDRIGRLIDNQKTLAQAHEAARQYQLKVKQEIGLDIPIQHKK